MLLLIFVLENINGRFWLSDFQVYYSAAKALRTHAEVYNVVFGVDTGLYKYSPLVLLFFIPFSFLAFKTAAIIFYGVSSIAVCYAFVLTQHLVARFLPGLTNRQAVLIISLAFFCTLNHLFREMHLGNVNMIMVCIILKAWNSILENRNLQAGILCGLAVLFKPYFILLAIPVLLQKKYKVILFALIIIIAMALFFLIFFGWGDLLILHQKWFGAMSDHSVFLSSSHTIQSLLFNYTGMGLAPTWLIFTVVGLLLSLFYLLAIKPASLNTDLIIVHLSISILALIPNLLITDTEHFLFSVPLIVWCLSCLTIQRNRTMMILFIVAVLLYGANSPEFFGSELSDTIENSGILGLANLMLVSISSYLLFNFRVYQNAVEQVIWK